MKNPRWSKTGGIYLMADNLNNKYRFDQLFKLLTSEWMILVVLVLIAGFYRFYQLDIIPPDFTFDEWAEVYDAQNFHEQGFQIFNTTNKGREPLFSYILSLALYFWESQDIVSRSIGALAGTLTVLITYPLVREMFRLMRPNQARWLATLTTLGMVTSYWQIHHTRIGMRHTLVPLMVSLTFYFLWRGLNRGRRIDFVWAGLLLGGALYTYPAARFIPILLIVFFTLEGLVQKLTHYSVEALWPKHWRKLLIMALSAIVVFAPLGYYFLFIGPEQFLKRASQIVVDNPSLSQGNILQPLARSVIGNFGGLAFHGDDYFILNLPGRPIFDPVMVTAFVIGLGIALIRFRRPPYLFVVVWWLVMMSPSFFVEDFIPSFKRSIGMAPAIYIFPALTWLTLGELLIRWGERKRLNYQKLIRVAAVIVPLLIYTVVGIVTYRDYFFIWGYGHPVYQKDVLLFKNLAEKMLRDRQDNEIWIFPTDIRNIIRRYHGLAGVLKDRNLPPTRFITVDERAMFDELSTAVQGRSRVVLVNVKNGQEWEADAKHIFPFLLEKYGSLDKVYISPKYNYDLAYYRLDSLNPLFRVANQWQPANVSFGENLMLVEVAAGDASGKNPPDSLQVPSGQTAWVALHWRAVGPLADDYQTSIRLTSPTGHIISQIDSLLTNARHRGTSHWQPGEDVFGYYLLPIEPGTAPNEHILNVLVYSSANFQPLPATRSGVTADMAQVGKIEVTPALTPPALTAKNELQVSWAPGLQLSGYGELPAKLQPGDKFSLALLWQNSSKLTKDEHVKLSLVSQKTVWPLLADEPVGGQAFPTSAWREGETINQWFEVQLPADLASGNYQLALSSLGTNTEITLGQIRVEGRQRLYDLPADIQHPLGNVTLGERVKLLGFNLNLSKADTMIVTLYWQALASMPESYKGFIHVLDAQGQIIAQRDQIPMAGQSPTTSWLPREIIVDDYTFSIPPGSVPAGTYQLAVGLYNEKTGQRLAVPNNPDNFFPLPNPIHVGN